MITALILAVVIVLIWKPWDAFNSCDAPKEYCALAAQLDQREGIDSTSVEHEITSVDAKDGNSSQASWTVKLNEHLAPEQAGDTAHWASSRIQAFIDQQSKVYSSIRFVAGEPQDSDVPNLALYPLDVSDSENVKEQIIQAFSLRQLGADSVGQGSAVAKDIQGMKALGRYAAEHDEPLSLRLEDSSLIYSSDQRLDPAEFNLALEAAALDDVDSAVFDSSGLSVHTTAEAGSEDTGRIKEWLAKHAPLEQPVAFTLSNAGYSDVIEGWVGGKLPEELIARPARLPDNVAAWPQDPAAPACTENDLELALGSPDAALGSRYMAVYAKNISTAPCAVEGYPQVQFRNSQGQAQQDVSLAPMASIQSERVVIPAGESILSALKWKAMSTANDPDATTSLDIAAAAGFEPTELVPEVEGSATSLDILDGGEISQSPWLQALEGWPVPGTAGQQSPGARP